MAPDQPPTDDTHTAVRASESYQAQLQQLGALTHGFLQALHLAWVASTRDPASREWLFWRFTDDLVSSAVGIASLVQDGIDRPPRRELRFMLELVIRNLYVDAKFGRETPLTTRMAYVEYKLGQEDVGLLDEMPLSQYLADPAAFKRTTKRLYGELSGFTHPSHEQLARRLGAWVSNGV